MLSRHAGLWRAVQPPPASIALTDNATDNTDAATYTFSSRAIGAPHASRVVIVAFAFVQSVSGTVAATSVTIGGITATKLVEANQNASSVSRVVSIWAARVPNETTATIVLNLSGASERAGLGVWRAINLRDIAANAVVSSDTTNGSPSSAILSVPSGGVVVGATFANNTGALATWSGAGLTIDFEQNLEATNSMSAASGVFQSSRTPTVTVSWDVSVTQRCFAVAALR